VTEPPRSRRDTAPSGTEAASAGEGGSVTVATTGRHRDLPTPDGDLVEFLLARLDQDEEAAGFVQASPAPSTLTTATSGAPEGPPPGVRPEPARGGEEGVLPQPARDSGSRSPASVAGGSMRRTTSEALAPVASIVFLTLAP
jgi:hypothetical protein